MRQKQIRYLKVDLIINKSNNDKILLLLIFSINIINFKLKILKLSQKTQIQQYKKTQLPAGQQLVNKLQLSLLRLQFLTYLRMSRNKNKAKNRHKIDYQCYDQPVYSNRNHAHKSQAKQYTKASLRQHMHDYQIQDSAPFEPDDEPYRRTNYQKRVSNYHKPNKIQKQFKKIFHNLQKPSIPKRVEQNNWIKKSEIQTQLQIETIKIGSLKQQALKKQKQIQKQAQQRKIRGIIYVANVIDHSEQIIFEKKDLTDFKRIKRIFCDTVSQAKNVEMRYSKKYPCVFFAYKSQKQLFPSLNNSKSESMFLRNFMVELNKKKKRIPSNLKDFVIDCYKSHYQIVPGQYEQLKGFAYIRALQKTKNNYLLNKLKNKEGRKQFAFFYAKSEEEDPFKKHMGSKFVYNFTMLNAQLYQFSFRAQDIVKCQHTHPIYYALYKKFEQNKGSGKQQTPQLTQLLQGQEADSDQEEDYEKVTQKQTNQKFERLQSLLQTDLSWLQNKIEQKNDQFNELRQNQPHKTAEIEKLGDEIEELVISLQNFVIVRDKVKKDVSGLRKADSQYEKVINMHLKKMIIAEKQMETRLPILLRKRKIFQLLDKHNLIILEGETGSGKSTQLPQMLCQYYDIFNPNKNVKPVLVTQPRRLATRSIAERVAIELDEKCRGFVDYMATVGKKINPNSKIIFKLDRLVLDELAADPTLSKYSCMVIDEAHERTISIDVILGLVKKLLKQRTDFKIIVTSASMDTQLFKEYYNTTIEKVSGRLYPVQTMYKPYRNEDDVVTKVIRTIQEEILKDDSRMNDMYKGHVLTFCSDTGQIATLCQYFKGKLNEKYFRVYPLHGKLTPQEQRKVFQTTHHYKLIFASRIAETAITIDGVTVVIDPGEDRQQVYDQKTKISTMKLNQISKSSAKQRAGRAGRTKAGFCFRLYSQGIFNNMRINKCPQIMNMALDTLVLRLKSLNIEDIINFPYITPPQESDLKASIQLMKMIGCLDKTQKITAIGNLLVRIPIEPFLSRAIIEGILFQKIQYDEQFWKQKKYLRDFPLLSCLIKTLCMIIHSDNIFYVLEENRESCEKIKFQDFSHEQGDFFFLRKVYEEFEKIILNPEKKQPFLLNEWARKHFISLKTMFQAKDLIKQIETIIGNTPFDFKLAKNQIMNMKAKILKCDNQNQLIVSCLISSFCANLCLYSGKEILGYTLLSQNRPLRIYGTSTLSLQGISPKWIVCYNLYQNEQKRQYCKVAHAIDIDKLQKIMDAYAYEAFNIKQIKQCNPFYEYQVFEEPTVVYRSIFSDYLKRETSKRYPFLNQLNVFFIEDFNRIEIFYNKNKLESTIKTSKNNEAVSEYFEEKIVDKKLKQKFASYLKNKRKSFLIPYKHNFIGNIHVKVKDGYKIDEDDISLTNNEKEYQVKFSQDLYEIVTQYFPNFGKVQFTSKGNEHTAKVFISDLQQAIKFQGLLKLIQGVGQSEIKWEKLLIDKRRKVPHAKIFLHFFAGETPPDKLLINYRNDIVTNQSLAPLMLECIEQALPKSRTPIASKLRNYRLMLTKKGTGINLFLKKFCEPTQLDEYDVMEQFCHMKKNNLIRYNFELPTSIRKFRQIDTKMSMKKNQEWIDQIQALLYVSGINYKQNTTIKVWGYYPCSKQERKNLSIFERKARINMHAEIKTLNIKALDKFKQKYNGKKLLGSEKLHIVSEFEQIIAMPNQRVFLSLQASYGAYVERYKNVYPQISFEEIPIKTKKGDVFMLKIRSPNREDLLQPTRVIGRIFTPKIIPLRQDHFKFLYKVTIGQYILDELEYAYNYQIYFGFERWNSIIKLYCQDGMQKQVLKQLSEQLQKYRYFDGKISYRGKNLHKVKSILENKKTELQKMSNNSKSFLQYSICFQKKEIQLTADSITFEQTKNEILKLSSQQKQQCQICSGIVERPYRLFICKHTFCWSCLAELLRVFRQSQNQLKCPDQKCNQSISIYDIKTLLSYQEFQNLSDIKISKQIQKLDAFHLCLSPNCQQIFQKAVSKEQGYFECELCGKWYCFKCQVSHKFYTCQQWKQQKNGLSETMLKKLGIKRCPKCRTGIQKNDGCNHMTCRNCKCHICWVCMKPFESKRQTEDHLVKQHGGIFPPNYFEQL